MHSHRWHFSSLVLRGNFLETLYDVEVSAEALDAKLYHYRRTELRGELVGVRDVALVECRKLQLSAGKLIRRKAGSFHRLNCVGTGRGLTLVRTGPEIDPYSRVVRHIGAGPNVTRPSRPRLEDIGVILEEFVAGEARTG